MAVVALLVACACGARGADFDDDEFETVPVSSKEAVRAPHEQAAAGAAAPEPVSAPAPQFVPPPSAAESLVTRFGGEVVFALFVAAFAACFVWGTRRNKEAAIEWLRLVRPVLDEHFSRVDTLLRLSPSSFRLYCTGRLNCFAAEVTLQLRPRQDLAMTLLGLFLATHETVAIDVPMTGQFFSLSLCFSSFLTSIADKLDPFVFALFPARKERKIRDDMGDLSLAKTRESPVTGLVHTADSSQIAKRVLAGETLAALEASAKWVNLIYCSDSFELYETEYKQMARFVFRLPPTAGELQLLLRLALKLVDAFASVSLNPAGLAKARAARKKFQSNRSKSTREELDAKAEEKKLVALAAERDKLASLTGKERARMEEKMQKKELKEKTKKKMKVVRM